MALETLGDTWSLLVVRDLMFKGRKTFSEFLHAEEGIASNILTDRLQKLEAAGILAKQDDPGDARRNVYRLTGKGMALAPVMVELVLWSARFEDTDTPPSVVQEMRSNRHRFIQGVHRMRKVSKTA